MKKFKKFPSVLEDRARELLLNSELTAKKIAAETGLTEAWLCDFSKYKVEHASAGRVEALYNYLSASPLKV